MTTEQMTAEQREFWLGKSDFNIEEVQVRLLDETRYTFRLVREGVVRGNVEVVHTTSQPPLPERSVRIAAIEKKFMRQTRLDEQLAAYNRMGRPYRFEQTAAGLQLT